MNLKLYTYDHCPYCVRVRLALGIKQMPFEHTVLLNDDEETPIGLIGAKLVPILIRQDGSPMGESLDIVRYLDEISPPAHFPEATHNEAIQAWHQETGDLLRRLLFPRWVNAPLPEFATEPARAYFTRKKTESIGDFSQALAETPALKGQLEEALLRLDPLIQSPEAALGSLSMEDIDLFGRLRGITLVRDLDIPERIRAYIDHFAEVGNVPLYDAIAV